jgi:hypothetical protein
MLEDTLDCGHTVRQNVGATIPARPPKRRRCWTCANAAREATAIFEARCETCWRENHPGYSIGSRRLSTRLRAKVEARRDAEEHISEHPGHTATVYTTAGGKS